VFDISNKHQSYGVLFVDVLTIIESCSLTITTIAIKLSIDSFLSTFSMKKAQFYHSLDELIAQ